jgi:RNA polymerase primary sigma factor
MYFADLRRIPLLSREEEKTYAARAREGDQEAKDMLIRSNLRFVVQVAKKYGKCGLPLSDLISEGTIGLMNAVERYDVDRGYHFISYAVWWIHQAILKAISQKAPMIRLPLNRAAEVTRLKKMIDDRKEKMGQEKVLRGVAEASGRDVKSVEHLLNVSRHHVSLDKEVNHEEDPSPLKEFIPDLAGKDPETEAVDHALAEEIGERYNVSKERVRQLQIRALKKLRDPARNARLRIYAR